MARTQKLVFSKENGIQKTWKYSRSGSFCTSCGHHHCIDPIGINGVKAMKKCKATAKQKMYERDYLSLVFNIEQDLLEEELDERLAQEMIDEEKLNMLSYSSCQPCAQFTLSFESL